MAFFKIVFWFSLFIVFYSYIGYGILIYCLVKLKKIFFSKKFPGENQLFEPDVTLVVSAFNEEDFIEKKIENTFQLDYPPSKLKIVFITDGSTDQTATIIGKYQRIILLHQPERRGKVAAMNRAMKFVTTSYVIFSDANTLLNTICVKEIIKHYRDPKVGGVAGEKKVISTTDSMAAGVGEGLYWKYESFLKKMDAALYSVVGAAGELFSVRKDLFEDAGEHVIIEDFVQSLKICMKGYIIQYEPNAFAMESSSATMKDEQKRKIRISAGAFQAMIIVKDLFNVFKYPVLSFQFISHRILRWTLCPVCLVLLFLSNAVLVTQETNSFYVFFFEGQVMMYSIAIIGWIFANRNIMVKVLYVPYYFLFMNLSVFIGFSRFLKKKQSVMWEKAARQKME
ncbi:MAG: glycosyltransferase family 2 protein [Bacteroidetes bacterium]|nr:glycosyltransferase family 2 protein [Bacteroidota bacterium]